MTTTRCGIVLLPDDLKDSKWLELMQATGIAELALHSDYLSLVRWSESTEGETWRAALDAAGIDLEFHLHFTPSWLTAELFARHPDWFAMDICGVRYHEWANPCTSNEALLDYAAQQAEACARRLRPSTHRYQLWAADGQPWCHCPDCAPYSPSDQNLRLMHALLEGLRRVDDQAELAYLAYMETLPVPNLPVRDGIFLTFAPYRRNMCLPLAKSDCWTNGEHRRQLAGLLRTFSPSSARVLEYWLDVSLFSYGRSRPAKEVTPAANLLTADATFYREQGFVDVTTFACRMNQGYLNQFGDDAVRRYGSVFAGSNPAAAD